MVPLILGNFFTFRLNFSVTKEDKRFFKFIPSSVANLIPSTGNNVGDSIINSGKFKNDISDIFKQVAYD